MAYNFPQGSDERDLRMMGATYKDADRRYGEQLGQSWPAIVAVISAIMLFGIWGGGAPAFYFLPAVVGLIVGAVA